MNLKRIKCVSLARHLNQGLQPRLDDRFKSLLLDGIQRRANDAQYKSKPKSQRENRK